ncbi:hypothetical protein CSAL01_00628 [Colletotrichum salicis]|uniref:Stf2-like protein n=1 Tax=Colletotrichum salicis TaxID=1209931 RepID=A0A135U2B2_9PEZI|nr:hypothetical protein CSAL01_00628 [Colletotrichum salicis]
MLFPIITGLYAGQLSTQTSTYFLDLAVFVPILDPWHLESSLTNTPFSVTRSHKYNDRDHAGLADGTAAPQEHLPRYFAKHGHEGVDPKKVKKNGGGRSNWGNAGEEVIDEDFRFTNARRRTNSSGFADNIGAFKTKFDVNEPEPVFEESIHGPSEEDGEDLTKTESSESGRSSTYDDEKITKH